MKRTPIQRRTHRQRPSRSASRAKAAPSSAPIFAALGDDTRLSILATLTGGPPCSIRRLTQGSRMTRQAITKHLRVLTDAGLVRGVRHGREKRFELDAGPLAEARRTLDIIARQWDDALARLKSFVEKT